MSISLYNVMPYGYAADDSSDLVRLTEYATADDGALAAHARTGDMGAFEELVRRYRNDVYSLAYRFVRNREEAWDASQEVFVKAHRALGRFRGDASFKTWVLRITANHCKDWLKKRRLKVTSLEEMSGPEPAANDGANPRRSASARELGAALDAALEALPAKHRTAIVLRELEGLSYQEMAEVMGCSMGTVMSRLHHARKKMQRSLIEMGAVEGETYAK